MQHAKRVVFPVFGSCVVTFSLSSQCNGERNTIFTQSVSILTSQEGSSVQTEYQPCAVGRSQTADLDLNQPSNQIHVCPCLRREGLAFKRKSVQT